MFVDETFGGLTSDTMLGDTTIELLVDGEQPIGAMKTKFVVPYYEQLPADGTEDLPDFNTLGTQIKILDSITGTVPTQDVIDLTGGDSE